MTEFLYRTIRRCRVWTPAGGTAPTLFAWVTSKPLSRRWSPKDNANGAVKEDNMNCYYHPDREVVGMCISCGKAMCAECKVELGERFYCNPCADKIFKS